jgi:hypothetical protein
MMCEDQDQTAVCQDDPDPHRDEDPFTQPFSSDSSSSASEDEDREGFLSSGPTYADVYFWDPDDHTGDLPPPLLGLEDDDHPPLNGRALFPWFGDLDKNDPAPPLGLCGPDFQIIITPGK